MKHTRARSRSCPLVSSLSLCAHRYLEILGAYENEDDATVLGMLLEKLCGLHALLQSAPELLGPFEVGRDLAIGVCVWGCVLCVSRSRWDASRSLCVCACVRVCVSRSRWAPGDLIAAA